MTLAGSICHWSRVCWGIHPVWPSPTSVRRSSLHSSPIRGTYSKIFFHTRRTHYSCVAAADDNKQWYCLRKYHCREDFDWLPDNTSTWAFAPLWWLLKAPSMFRFKRRTGAMADGLILRLPMVVPSIGRSPALLWPILYLVSPAWSLVISSFSDSVYRCWRSEVWFHPAAVQPSCVLVFHVRSFPIKREYQRKHNIP